MNLKFSGWLQSNSYNFVNFKSNSKISKFISMWTVNPLNQPSKVPNLNRYDFKDLEFKTIKFNS